MKKRSKALLLTLCAVMLMVASVLGTMAYLTDQDDVVNTFTVGKVYIDLDEAKTNLDGTRAEPAERTEEGNTYHLLPGHTYVKDPTVTVNADSEDAYVRMLVRVENIDHLKEALEDSKYYGDGDVFLLQMLCVDKDGNLTWNPDDWAFVEYNAEQEAGKNVGVYEFRYVKTENGTVAKAESDTILPALFTHITVPGELDNTSLALLEDVKITVVAHAIQADGFDNAAEAWEHFK